MNSAMLSGVAGVPLQRRPLDEPGPTERLPDRSVTLAPALRAVAGLPVRSTAGESQKRLRF